MCRHLLENLSTPEWDSDVPKMSSISYFTINYIQKQWQNMTAAGTLSEKTFNLHIKVHYHSTFYFSKFLKTLKHSKSCSTFLLRLNPILVKTESANNNLF